MPGAEAYRTFRIDRLKAPLLVSWQMTRECDLSCLHCCTGSAPGKRLTDELDALQARQLAEQLISNEVPYVMLCGGEPLMVPHFPALAQQLGAAGVALKLETNGQRLDQALIARLAGLPVRSVQISLDADSQSVYVGQRPGGSLQLAHTACRNVRSAGLPLEVTFAPTRLNIHELQPVIERAASLGAFRFNTGQLMRMGTAARRWHKLAPSPQQYRTFRDTLLRARGRAETMDMELSFTPFSIVDALRASLDEPPATLLVLPNGWVKVAAALPHICADLRRHTLAECWARYRAAWRSSTIRTALQAAIDDESTHAESNAWRMTAHALN
jgi:MoaA/NifB/PqqE/SkfB family radical SAM enzyme